MFPAFDQTTLQDNPQFAILYKQLGSNKLNRDASTQGHLAQKKCEVATKKLKIHQARCARRAIIRDGLKESSLEPKSSRESPLPLELIELIILLTQQLSATSNYSWIRDILQTDSFYSSLFNHSDQIGKLLSDHLHARSLPIARILSSATNDTYLYRQICTIPLDFAELQQHVEAQRTALEDARKSLVPLFNTILASYTSAIQLTILILEQTQHGVLARHSKTTAETLSLSAQTLNQNILIVEKNAYNTIYTPEVREALRIYGEHLRDGCVRLKAREKEAKKELARYGVGDESEEGSRRERILREIARVYGEIWSECETVRGEVERLKIG